MIQRNENRRHPRVKVSTEAPEVMLYLVSESGTCDQRRVRALDVSRMGMSFHENAAIKAGTRCTILINHRRQPMRIVGRVLNCHPGPKGGHIIGVKFVSITPITSEDLTVPLCDSEALAGLLIDPHAQ